MKYFFVLNSILRSGISSFSEQFPKKKKYIPVIIISIFFLTIFTGCSKKAYEDFSYWKYIDLPAFEELHSQVGTDSNEYLLLGNLPFEEPADNIPDDLEGLIGRWEGYDLSPPVPKDLKIVLVIQEIKEEYITFKQWTGFNLQNNHEYNEIRANIINRKPLTFRVDSLLFENYPEPCTLQFIYNKDNETLQGEIKTISGEAFPYQGEKLTFALRRESNFRVFKDYAKYLTSKSIYTKEYDQEKLTKFGTGYMYYLPKNYNPKEKYPVLVFFHGSGDRGNDIEILAKASPFMFIRETGDLPFIIVAPLLNKTQEIYFPLEYMENFMDIIISDYNVDQSRIYLTGLSTGGEAVLRYAIYHPDQPAATAALCAPLTLPNQLSKGWTDEFPLIDRPLSALKDKAIQIIQGTNDPIILPEEAEENYKTFLTAGADVELIMLEEHDHDVWTDTYSDPEFYQWLLEHQK